MPTQWPDELYDYVAKEIKHADIDSLDLDKGKWFKCKHCKNPKYAEGKFHCRTAFSGEQVNGSRGHMESTVGGCSLGSPLISPLVRGFLFYFEVFSSIFWVSRFAPLFLGFLLEVEEKT